MALLNTRLFRVRYAPRPEEQAFLQRAMVQRDDELIIQAAVLDDRESERFFGVDLAHKGMQPVWLRITNTGKQLYRLRLASLDPSYYPPLEAAFVNHFAIGKRLIGFGMLAWLFLPLLILLPFKILSAWSANRRMDAFFQEHGISSGLIVPGQDLAGFVFTSHDAGTKQLAVRLTGPKGVKAFSFSIVIPGLRVDHGGKRFEQLLSSSASIECDEGELQKRLAALPRSTTNKRATVEGDPLNLVVIGDFDTIINGLGARWDETETISFSSCWRMAKAFVFGTGYRYSPVSPLFVEGRSQDFALQKARQTINERLHLRLWLTPLRFLGKPVWIGQISRDIGVRFTLKTWNLTTHKIDPNVDEARDYLLDDLMEAGRVSHAAYVAGAQPSERAIPRRNLTGDPYFTNGLRAVAVFSDTRTEPIFLQWAADEA
ncbi:MAG TPA: LssY C-terminal domain-containing protein [Gemmataceae bacterium]|nr:LssY C-terminal domain-containing protein [Gemmataceae bacterium]